MSIEKGCETKTITGSRESVVTPGESGRTWTTEATRNGPAGTSTYEGTGEARREGRAVNWQSEGTWTHESGRQADVEARGTRTRADGEGRSQSATRVNRQKPAR